MNPILKNIPAEIVTERLRLRMPEVGDGQAVNAAIQASLNELKPWMEFVREVPSVEDTEANMREAIASFITRKSLRLLIFHRETDEFIGSSGFHGIDWEVPKVEIGYWMDSRHSGQGFMTEAVAAQTDFAFEHLQVRRVQILCDTKNKQSRAIPERLGFELEGILYNDSLSVDGQIRSTAYYAKTR